MSSPQEDPSERPWLRGAVISGVGAVIGIIAFILFCHSLGLNFRDEGWSENGDAWQSNRGELILSLVGFAIAILVFWLGFLKTTTSKRE